MNIRLPLEELISVNLNAYDDEKMMKAAQDIYDG